MRLHGIRPGLALFVLALGLAAAQPARAQMTFDGNIVWNNNLAGGNTLANQFVGSPTADSTTCPVGYDALTLGTVTFTHNVWVDPQLPSSCVYTPDVVPDFRPAIGSPAYGYAVVVPDPWFQQTCYVGALSPDPSEDWIPTSTWGNNPSAGDLAVPNQGWVYYDSTGANRHDLHLASNGDPDPRPLAIYDHILLYSSQTWSADSNYLVRGFLRVKDQATLTIPAGTVILEDVATLGTLVSDRGGRIVAVGTQDNPIIITSADPPGQQTTGAGGGLYMLGYGKVNLVNSCAGDSAGAEGGDVGYYGGDDNHDDSGQLKYVRVEFAGQEITPNNELNSFTFCGVGDNTQLEYLEAFDGVDDCWEFFGGAANIRHCIGIDGRDDGYDEQMGYQGMGQFIIVRPWAGKSPAGDQNGDKGCEWDNNEYEYTALRCAGRSYPMASNCTFIGDHRQGPTWPGPSSAVNMRNGTAGLVVNSICYNFKIGALKVDVNETWRAHCLAIPSEPQLFCNHPGGVEEHTVADGNLMVVRGWPNPFQRNLNVAFTLPRAGHVLVEVYSADGRRVGVLANEDMAAGPHTVNWKVGRNLPTGMYFYRVSSRGLVSHGKISRID